MIDRNFKELKRRIDCRELAQSYLGTPQKFYRDTLWFQSPFNKPDKTASLEVKKKSIHDFSTGKHYSAIDFIMELERIDCKEAFNRLCREYGYQDLYDKQISNEEAQVRNFEMKIRKKLMKVSNKWFSEKYKDLCYYKSQLEKILVTKKLDYETLEYIFDEHIKTTNKLNTMDEVKDQGRVVQYYMQQITGLGITVGDRENDKKI